MRTKRNMNCILLVTFISLAFVLPSLSDVKGESKIEGLIELDCPHVGEATVEVNLSGSLLSFATGTIAAQVPELSEFLGGIQAVRVRLYKDMDPQIAGAGLREVLEFYQVRLQKEKWEVLASVKEGESEALIIYSLPKGNIISGLFALFGEDGELLVVNLAGEMDFAKLPNIDVISSLGLPLPHLGTMLNIKKKTQAQTDADAPSGVNSGSLRGAGESSGQRGGGGGSSGGRR